MGFVPFERILRRFGSECRRESGLSQRPGQCGADRASTSEAIRIGRKLGPSNAYLRVLRGELAPERYVAIVKRATAIHRRRGVTVRAAQNTERKPR